MPRIEVRRLCDTDMEGLADLLIDTVAGGASIGWVRIPSRAEALAFWQRVMASAARGERLAWGIEREGRLVGSAQLLLDQPQNGQHRAEVCKVMVHPGERRQGLGEALMRAVETEARQRGKKLLILDTNTGSSAERLYTRLGFELCGVMPSYAEQADGSLGATSWMFKRV